jgi:zinc/manganese transport system permease protein
MLPAIAARFWVHDVGRLSALAGVLAVFSGYVGLLLSYHAALPSGPSIVMVAGALYLFSLCVGTRDSLRSRFAQRLHHRAA